ncbi:MAG: prenyltransferase [Sphingobacteriia bacterium]|nr:prenyltransferase [Sphingobacteriia bacterium]
MSNQNNLKSWLAQFRVNFLILAVLLVLIGVATAAMFPGSNKISILSIVLLTIGMVSAHSSVNLFNEYSDYNTGIDFNTNRSPFSGGSGMLPTGKTKPAAVLNAAIITLIISAAIGIYFAIVAHWSILALSIIGGLSIVFYTPFLAKIALGELIAGLSLGTLPVIGSYIALTATPNQSLSEILPNGVIWLSIAPGILTALLLFINEFPDVEADIKGGRKHLVIIMGRKRAALLYVIGLVATFVSIIGCMIAGILSWWGILALLTIPVALKAGTTALKEYNNTPKLIPALGMNVITVLATDLLLAVSIFLS